MQNAADPLDSMVDKYVDRGGIGRVIQAELLVRKKESRNDEDLNSAWFEQLENITTITTVAIMEHGDKLSQTRIV